MATKKKKPCVKCGLQPKKWDHHLWCFDCWLAAQTIEIREKWMKWRQAAIPEALRIARVGAADWPPGRRWCSGCQTFVRLADVASGASRCRTCNSVSAHAGRVEKVYGITADEYRLLFIAQGGRCFICQRVARSKRLAVDHNHETGEVRGLLCADSERGCNHAILGNIRDIAMAERIVDYLREPPARSVLTRHRQG